MGAVTCAEQLAACPTAIPLETSPVNHQPDRRQFGTAIAGVVAAGLLADRKLAAGEFTGRIRKAVKYHMIDEPLSPADKLKLIRDVGFDGVEPRTMLGPGQAEEAAELARASEQTGVPIHGVVNSSNPNLVEAIDQAVQLGGNSVLHVVRYDTKRPYMENYRQTQDLLRGAADHAAKKQVFILLENVWATFLIEPLSMQRFLDEIDSPWVGAYFDVGNVVRWGWPQHWIEVLGKRIKKLDIKEYDLQVAMNEGMRAGFGKPLGEGSIDWAAVRRELMEIDYRGWATAEVPGGDRQRLADIAQQMDRVLDLGTA